MGSVGVKSQMLSGTTSHTHFRLHFTDHNLSIVNAEIVQPDMLL